MGRLRYREDVLRRLSLPLATLLAAVALAGAGPDAPETYIPALRQRHGIASLPLSEEAALYLGRLPILHRDPFDRMLVCQSIVDGMVLLTPDASISRYPVRSIW